MSATQRFWHSTSFDHAHISSNSLGQHHSSSSFVPPVAAAAGTVAPIPVNVDNIATFRYTVNAAGRKASSPSPAGAGPGIRFPQQQQRDYYQQSQSQPLQRASPSVMSTNSMIMSPSAAAQQQPLYMVPSPVISAPSTPLLLAKELPLAPPLVPQTPPPHILSSSTSNNTVNSTNTNTNASPAPAPASSSSSVHPDMYHHSHSRPAQQLLYRRGHSRSSSVSSTNNVIFPSVAVSSIPAANANTNNVPIPSPVISTSSIMSPTTPILSTQAPSPVTPHSNNHSRRASLITTSLTNVTTPTSSNGSGFPTSAPMSPSSSYGLPSPTFPPRPLPPHAHAITHTPVRPPRSPARPPGIISPLTSLTSLPTPVSSSSNASSSPNPPTSQPIPRVKPPTTGMGMIGTNALTSGSMSRRNSRQVSVRLSTAFFQPPSVPGSRSVSRSRAVPTTADTADVFVNINDGFGNPISSRRGSEVTYNNNAGQLEVLRPGDIIGQGCFLHGEIVRVVPGGSSSNASATGANKLGTKYEVVRSLGTGSYAVVYLVREILPPPPKAADVFDEDVFGLVQPPQPPFGVYSLATRSLSNRSTTTRRSSLLKPIDERLSPTSPLSTIPLSPSSPASYTYGKEFAIKVLSKSNLDSDELAVQMTEVTIHQSLKVHPNIVTLHCSLETDALLLLVLEYVPGEDLYYFLEQQQKEKDACGGGDGEKEKKRGSMYSVSSSGRAGSSSYDSASESGSDADVFEEDEDGEPVRGRRAHRRNHHRRRPTTTAFNDDDMDDEVEEPHVATTEGSGTPPTPSLLSSVHPAHMLSQGRLRLIASMFSQMCDAVQACHAQGIAHRDIKPENFIVTSSSACSNSNKDERKVIVKLSDFGLATTEKFSADVDCGSAPYMSYECRNVVGPTYATQPADVWSLGIVLINMLYHHNLWQDTFEGDEFFEAFRQQPVTFLMERSPGMTRDVAEFLAERVFHILPDTPSADANTDPEAWAKYEQDIARVRVSAGEFGDWVRNLPASFFNNTAPGTSAVTATAPDSRPSSVHSAVAAGLTHSPGCAYNQLQESAVADTEDEEDEYEVEAMFADETFTQADARRRSFERDDEDVEDYGTILHNGTTPIFSGLVPHTQSSLSAARSIPVSPRSLPPSSPLPSEPIPIARPVGGVEFADHNLGSSSPLTSFAPNGECMACSYDEQLGLGLSGAMLPVEAETEDPKRSASGVRSRKRGRRRKDASISGITGPSTGASAPPLPPAHLHGLAQDMQNLARELSRTRPQSTPRPRSTSRSRSRAPTASHQTTVPPTPSLPSLSAGDITSSLDFPNIDPSSPSLPPSVAAAVAPTKKPSRWNLLSSWRDRDGDGAQAASERAASILKGLDSTYRPSPSRSTAGGSKSQTSSSSSSSSHFSSFDSAHRSSVTSSVSTAATTVSTQSSIAFVPPPLPQNFPMPTSAGWDVPSTGTAWRDRPQQQHNGWDSSSPPTRSGLHERRERSPMSNTHNGRSNATTVTSWRKDQHGSVPASAASSMYNGSSGGGSSSASSTFTRFRNGSEMSFSTTATSVSASSAFNIGGTAGVLGQHYDKKPHSPPARPSPKVNSPPPPQAKQQQRSGHQLNVKPMSGIPWELQEYGLPRQVQPFVSGKPMGNVHGGPPPRRGGHRNGAAPQKPPALDTITERPKGARRATSPSAESAESDGSGSPVEQQQPQPQPQQKKVQKAQINTLAKILTSFKTKRD